MPPVRPTARLRPRNIYVAVAGLLIGLVVAVGFAPRNAAASAAQLYFSPSSGTYTTGSSIAVSVYVNTGGDPVNAVESDFSYPSSKLQFQSYDGSGSAFGLDASHSISGGTASIARGTSGGASAVTGVGLVAVVHFTVLATGSATLTFLGSSAVVRSTDNTNILSTYPSATFTLNAAATPTPKPPVTHTPTPAPTKTSTTPAPKASTTPGAAGTTPTPPTTPTPTPGSSSATPTATSSATPVPAASSHHSTLVLGAAIGIPILALLALGGFLFSRSSRLPDIAAHGSDQAYVVNPSAPSTPVMPTDMPASPAPPAPNGQSPTPGQTYMPDSQNKN